MSEVSEVVTRQKYPINFEIIEAHSSPKAKDRRMFVYIGNTGGEFVWYIGRDYFEQHFTPDGRIDEPNDEVLRRQYAILYPACLYKFLVWQKNLDLEDERRNISKIKGSTNKQMSDFRKKLLGEAYSFKEKINEQNPEKPIFEYEIDINKIRDNDLLMRKLEKYYKRAVNKNYLTTNNMPQGGEMEYINITLYKV